jgi:hypothetical protein
MSTELNARYSLLRDLRSLAPSRSLTYGDLRRVTERQAARLGHYLGREGDRLDLTKLHQLPRVKIQLGWKMPVSGLTEWNGDSWLITVAGFDIRGRQRLTTLHEFWHVIQHPRSDQLTETQQERLADYFAGCALIPGVVLKRLWYAGVQRLDVLAARFDVSQRAVEVRLMQVGLLESISSSTQPGRLAPGQSAETAETA